MRTANAINARTGERRTTAAAATVASIRRLTDPEKPRTDLCGLNFGNTGGRAPGCPLVDDVSNFGLEVFTRKFLHLMPDLLHRPRQRFRSADRPHDIVHTLLPEKDPIDAILNRFQRTAGAQSDNRTTTCLSLDH